MSIRANADSSSCNNSNNCRQLSDIIWDCFVTIFAATWVSVHPNIPAPGQHWLIITFRKLGMMLVAIIAPESIIFFATRQLVVAWEFSKKFDVSITHVFFFSMGGFVSRVGHYPISTMTITQLEDALRGPEYISDIRNIAADDIMDKSKGDAFSKGVALLQGLWFITQILVRFAEHLPISELEVVTLAFPVVNIFIWLLWWYKPLDVQQPILIGPPANKAV
ncbi:hypothetical protein DFH07DRAFT_1063138, partial [Mycena maculata]